MLCTRRLHSFTHKQEMHASFNRNILKFIAIRAAVTAPKKNEYARQINKVFEKNT